MNNKKIFITGGCGFLGQLLIDKYYDHNEIAVYSRDEAKHYLVRQKYPKVKFICGDIRDRHRLVLSGKGYEVGIFAASMKQLSSCDENPKEALEIIGIGALNSRDCALENKFDSAVFISSDKACNPSMIYGFAKAFGEQAFILNNDSSVNLTACRYGNVLNSTSSIIPLIWNSIKIGRPLQLFSDSMTRFLIEGECAVNLIEKSLRHSGCILVPDLKSCRIRDLFEIYTTFGLKYSLSSPRIGEKLHEDMISPIESTRCIKEHDYYRIYPQHVQGTIDNNGGISSRDCVISKQDLFLLLEKYNFFKP